MQTITLPAPPDYGDWQRSAKSALMAGIPPHEILWQTENEAEADLFAAPSSVSTKAEKAKQATAANAPRKAPHKAPHKAPTIPARFESLAKDALCHNKSERFTLLYRLLWRLVHENRHLLKLTTDQDVMRLNQMVRQVRRDSYKITAFLRFREIIEQEESRFIAWYEPEHYTLERTLPFFTTRFANMRWSILTPYRAAHWDGETLTLKDAPSKAEHPKQDHLEHYWLKYYASIFNPARPKKAAMLNEMPMKYWKNMPETKLIPGLLQQAESRAKEMIANSEKMRATAPPPQTTAIKRQR